LVHILEVLVSILDVDIGYLVTFRVSSQYMKAGATTVPQITLEKILSILHKMHPSLTILTYDAIRL